MQDDGPSTPAWETPGRSSPGEHPSSPSSPPQVTRTWWQGLQAGKGCTYPFLPLLSLKIRYLEGSQALCMLTAANPVITNNNCSKSVFPFRRPQRVHRVPRVFAQKMEMRPLDPRPPCSSLLRLRAISAPKNPGVPISRGQGKPLLYPGSAQDLKSGFQVLHSTSWCTQSSFPRKTLPDLHTETNPFAHIGARRSTTALLVGDPGEFSPGRQSRPRS